MNQDTILAIINVVLILLFCGGAVVLQVFLSRSERKWPGFILPGISALFSVFSVLSFALYRTISTTSSNGVTATQVQQVGIGDILALALVFLLCNIPTVVLLAIFAVTRAKLNKAAELEKMSVQDLE